MTKRSVLALTALIVCTGACRRQAASGAPGPARSQERSRGYVLRTGEGEGLGPGRLIKASPKRGTQGGVVVLDQLPAGFTTGFHAHTKADEFFYVINGSGSASIDEQDVAIGPGDFVFVPARGKHRMSVADTGPMELLYFLDQPGLDDFFREAHTLYFSKARPMSLDECNAIGQKYATVCITLQ